MTLAIGVRPAILLLNGGRCRYCGGVADTVDHVVPICKGGTDAPNNLVAACGICNMSKNGSSLHPDTERVLLDEAQSKAEEAERLVVSSNWRKRPPSSGRRYPWSGKTYFGMSSVTRRTILVPEQMIARLKLALKKIGL